MSFTAVPTATTLDVLTSAMWNTYVRDNLMSGVMRPIADVEVTDAAASIDFENIPQTMATLVLVTSLRGTAAGTSVGDRYRFNGDSGSTYDHVRRWMANTTPTTSAALLGTYIEGLYAAAASAPANVYAAGVTFIPGYTLSAWTAITQLQGYRSAATTGTIYLGSGGGVWHSTNPVTGITVYPASGSWEVGSRATLYGIGGT